MTETALHDVQGDRLQNTLRAVLEENSGLLGVLVGTADGLFVAGEFDVSTGVSTLAEAETLSAMASVTAGMGGRFADRLSLGGDVGSVVYGSAGCASVQRVGRNGVLVLFGDNGLTVGRLHLLLRNAVPRVQEVLEETDV